MKSLLIISVLFASQLSLAVVKCTDQAKQLWQKEDVFQKKLISEGYKIKTFKVTEGYCYEIYGWDKNSKKVEIYFNPVTGEIIKQK